MKPSLLQPARRAHDRRQEQAQTKLVVLAVLFLIAGFAAGVYWHHQAGGKSGTTDNSQPADNQSAGLSEGTLAVLKRINGTVQIRYYTLLDPATASDSLKSFSQRVDHLLSGYQDAANGRLTVTRRTSPADDSPAAHAEGLTPFNLDKGDACYLGIAISFASHKEVLARLSPEWEAAVEPDITRAIARLLDASQSGGIVAAPPDQEIIDAVKRIVPDVNATSLEDGKKLLQTAALQEYAAAAKELGDQLKDAQQRLSQAQAGGSDADQQAAMKNLQDVQAAQSAKLQQIATRSRAEMQAFEELKKSAK